MNAQPEALRLADELGIPHQCDFHIVCEKAADELRRLHQFAEDQIGRATAAEAALQMTKATHALKIAAVETQRDVLLEALKEAATSLETVGRLAGKSDYLGDAGERIPTYMGRHDEVREYATSRAGVARAAIKAVEGEKK